MISVWKIVVYIFLSIMTYYLIGGKLRFSFRETRLRNNNILCIRNYSVKSSITVLIIISVLWGWYSIYSGAYPYVWDRKNYAHHFLSKSYYSNSSVGILFIKEVLRNYTQNPDVFFFTVTFITVLVYIIAYRLDENKSRESLKLFLLGNCIILSFTGLKQAPSLAFGSVAIILALRKKYILSILFILLSLSFHEAAIIMIPIFIFIVWGKSKTIRTISYLMMIIVLPTFSVFSKYMLGFLSNWIPYLAQEAEAYTDASGAMVVSNAVSSIVALKGIPYYLITILGIKKRKQLVHKINNYDSFLLIGVLCSVCWLLSLYMYWLFRLAMYCYFPIFTFMGQIIIKDNSKETQYMKYIVNFLLLFLTYRYIFLLFYLNGGF